MQNHLLKTASYCTMSSNSAKNVKSTQQSKPSVKKEKHSTTTLATQSATTALVTNTRGSTQQEGKKKECTKCKKDDHHISTCKSFSKANPTERTNFVRDNKLCFNCLNPGHQIAYCRNSKRCATCKKAPYTALRRQLPEKRITCNHDRNSVSASIMHVKSPSRISTNFTCPNLLQGPRNHWCCTS